MRQCAPYVDCASISCGDMPRSEIEKQMTLIRKFGCRHIVIATRGAKGALVMVDGRLYEQSPCLVEAVDTMGAGDSFITRFLVGYCDGMKWARNFPEGSGNHGLTQAEGYQEHLVQVCLSQAAVFSSGTCKRDGAFGYGKEW